MAMVNIRIDDDLKAGADLVYRKLNVSATDAITQLYRYVEQYQRLPFNDPYLVLYQMHHSLNKAYDVAKTLISKNAEDGYITIAERDAARAVFDGTVRSLEDNYGVLKSACGGFLPQAWVNASNAMKGLIWMITMCTVPVKGGVTVKAELDQATRSLAESFIEISALTESIITRHQP